jgi:hypothetical protein
MPQDPMDNDKVNELFSEIVQSTNMDEVTENVEMEFNLNVKELAFLQESLGESIACISQIMFMVINSDSKINDEISELLGNLYKLSEDLNASMIELYIDDIDDYEDLDLDGYDDDEYDGE